MPLKNKKARQAKTQRVQGEKFFKKGFINNLDNQNDPDWIDEEDLNSDSEFEGDGGWAVSISEVTVPDPVDVSDSEDEEEKVLERRNGKGGIKRKAAINKGKGSDENEKGAEEFEAHRILSGAEAFWKENFSKPVDLFKAPPPLTSKGSYGGTSHANTFKKQATLRKAAAGSAKISGFFTSVLKPTGLEHPIEVLKIESSSSEGTSSDSGDEEWVDIPNEEPHLSVTPASDTSDSDVANSELPVIRKSNDFFKHKMTFLNTERLF
ncbi:hypothetical protein F5888DRAFT_1846203 [Russula emetica]|nr:hypothetical protein F5888DRAFT_1846203 [Russula emetica]